MLFLLPGHCPRDEHSHQPKKRELLCVGNHGHSHHDAAIRAARLTCLLSRLPKIRSSAARMGMMMLKDRPDFEGS